MSAADWLERLADHPVLAIDAAELAALLADCRMLSETKPPLAAPIRLLACGEAFLAQETSDKGEILLRRFAGEAPARDFIARRVETYERMWDGCGCKVNYYE